ncbi:MAG: AI-2E family transporter [Deltaproteobacteria bacterium]|nr:AI-2E family transporter [Deltaproteobacteria bacterium]
MRCTTIMPARLAANPPEVRCGSRVSAFAGGSPRSWHMPCFLAGRGFHLLFILGFLSIVLAALFSFPIRLFARFGIGRGGGVLLTLLLVGVVVAGLGFATVPQVTEQGKQIREQLPRALDSIQQWFSHARHSVALEKITGDGKGAADQAVKQGVSEAMSGIGSKLLPAAFGVGEALLTGIFLLVLAAFLAYAPDTYREGVRMLLPRRFEAQFDEGWNRVGSGLRRWVGGIVVSMSIMGALTALGLAVVGIPGWYTLALFTFFGTFVPYLGAIASAIPGLAMALAQGPQKFIFTAIVYLGVHITEGYIVEPFVMRRTVELPPALLLFWQAFMGTIFGVPGIVIATPLLVVVKRIIKYYYVELRLGRGLHNQKGGKS